MTFGPRHPCRFMMEDQIEMKSVHIWETPTERRIFTDVFRSLSFLVKGWPNEYREAAWQAELGRISYSFHCSRRRGRHPCCSRKTPMPHYTFAWSDVVEPTLVDLANNSAA